MKETELCDAYQTRIESEGWTVYPEVAGFDLVAVRDEIQVGIEAKVVANVTVLSQLLDRTRRAARVPNHVVALVPRASQEFVSVANYLNFGVVELERILNPEKFMRVRRRSRRHRRLLPYNLDHVLLPLPREAERLWLPPVPVQKSGGAPNPSPLTEWRVQAIRLCLRLREAGHVTPADFKELAISSRTWTYRGRWLRYDKSEKKYYPTNGEPLPITGFENEAVEIEKVYTK